MIKPLLATMVLVTALTGCSRLAESRINPFNWFGGSRSEARTAPAVETVTVRDSRQLVGQVTRLSVERTPGGAIITAVGLPPSQGYWDAELVPATPDGLPRNGVMVYDFRIERPLEFQIEGPPRSREVTVGIHLSNIELASISRIIVRGQVNQRSASR
ncbi:hypothetical protein [Vannielia litorea]|uniref:hypothetical protein n=1 Tax=Vannielia litorea TaxID=1217970 RepID=UPI001C957369|nr:hypothetical protein [Vannielia litorea]MBY6047635.1 hypothetical protein [Vannielia litorea]MBY6075049.1 hypothetical protein [Vannielia litorea]